VIHDYMRLQIGVANEIISSKIER